MMWQYTVEFGKVPESDFERNGMFIKPFETFSSALDILEMLGFIPETFQQTYYAADEGHLRSKFKNIDVPLSARICNDERGYSLKIINTSLHRGFWKEPEPSTPKHVGDIVSFYNFVKWESPKPFESSSKFRVIKQDRDLHRTLIMADRDGYIPGKIKQTEGAGGDAHLVLHNKKTESESYGLITSELFDGNIWYVFYEPVLETCKKELICKN
ncbi:MAG: hypothetical protein Q7J54_01000 [Candidatus Woesearchaeota archaeon]|nr:hypothetical protein [Candidatus Woesearchaeota archaeon]